MTTPFMTTLADCVLLAQLPPYEPLRRKLERAVVVSSEAVPADVATMNSRVRYTDGAQQRVLTAGEGADYTLGDGTVRRLHLEAVLDQPERALHRRSIDDRLDEGLELTYPASDPLAVSP